MWPFSSRQIAPERAASLIAPRLIGHALVIVRTVERELLQHMEPPHPPSPALYEAGLAEALVLDGHWLDRQAFGFGGPGWRATFSDHLWPGCFLLLRATWEDLSGGENWISPFFAESVAEGVVARFTGIYNERQLFYTKCRMPQPGDYSFDGALFWEGLRNVFGAMNGSAIDLNDVSDKSLGLFAYTGIVASVPTLRVRDAFQKGR